MVISFQPADRSAPGPRAIACGGSARAGIGATGDVCDDNGGPAAPRVCRGRCKCSATPSAAPEAGPAAPRRILQFYETKDGLGRGLHWAAWRHKAAPLNIPDLLSAAGAPLKNERSLFHSVFEPEPQRRLIGLGFASADTFFCNTVGRNLHLFSLWTCTFHAWNREI